MKQTISYKNDQILSYAEFGNQHGFPILIQHGLIASISDSWLFDRLIASGAHLVCMARPGYGESTPYAMRNIAEWGEIAAVLVDKLELHQFDVLGMSSGAPYSYSIGCQFPDKVRNIYIFSGIPAMYSDEVLSYWPFPVDRNADIADLQKLAYELFFARLSPEDLSHNDIRDSMMNNCFGLALDFKLRCNDWGLSLSDVKANVWMRHSRFDNLIPAEITSRLLPHCILDIHESDVHFSKETLDDFIQQTIAPFYVMKKLC